MAYGAEALLGASNLVIANPSAGAVLKGKGNTMSDAQSVQTVPTRAEGEGFFHLAKRAAWPATKQFGLATIGFGAAGGLGMVSQNRLVKAGVSAASALACLAFRQPSMAIGAGIQLVRNLADSVFNGIAGEGGILGDADELTEDDLEDLLGDIEELDPEDIEELLGESPELEDLFAGADDDAMLLGDDFDDDAMLLGDDYEDAMLLGADGLVL